MKMKVIVSTLLSLAVFFYSVALKALPTRSFYGCVYVLNAEPSFQYKIIQAPNNTWGYDILIDHKIFIHQPNRPGLPGNDGFTTKKDAIKVAELVLVKIKNGEIPPTISLEELKALKLAN
jgi:hypothetical protein